MPAPGQPLELILARNLIASMTVPSFLADAAGSIVFYNDAAGDLLGSRFEETGRLSREQWAAIGPFDEHGELTGQKLPLTTALRENRPAHGRFRICTDTTGLEMVETSALPLMGTNGLTGAIVVFWPSRER